MMMSLPNQPSAHVMVILTTNNSDYTGAISESQRSCGKYATVAAGYAHLQSSYIFLS